MNEQNQPPKEENQDNDSGDSPEVKQFADMINHVHQEWSAKQTPLHPENQTSNKPLIFVSYDTADPDLLLRAQEAGELFSRQEIQDEFYKTQETNTEFRGQVEDIHEFTNKGKRMINVTYRPIGINVPFPIGFQAKEGQRLFPSVDQLPKDYRGEIIVTTNEHGGVDSVKIPD